MISNYDFKNHIMTPGCINFFPCHISISVFKSSCLTDYIIIKQDIEQRFNKKNLIRDIMFVNILTIFR